MEDHTDSVVLCDTNLRSAQAHPDKPKQRRKRNFPQKRPWSRVKRTKCQQMKTHPAAKTAKWCPSGGQKIKPKALGTNVRIQNTKASVRVSPRAHNQRRECGCCAEDTSAHNLLQKTSPKAAQETVIEQRQSTPLTPPLTTSTVPDSEVSPDKNTPVLPHIELDNAALYEDVTSYFDHANVSQNIAQSTNADVGKEIMETLTDIKQNLNQEGTRLKRKRKRSSQLQLQAQFLDENSPWWADVKASIQQGSRRRRSVCNQSVCCKREDSNLGLCLPLGEKPAQSTRHRESEKDKAHEHEQCHTSGHCEELKHTTAHDVCARSPDVVTYRFVRKNDAISTQQQTITTSAQMSGNITASHQGQGDADMVCHSQVMQDAENLESDKQIPELSGARRQHIAVSLDMSECNNSIVNPASNVAQHRVSQGIEDDNTNQGGCATGNSYAFNDLFSLLHTQRRLNASPLTSNGFATTNNAAVRASSNLTLPSTSSIDSMSTATSTHTSRFVTSPSSLGAQSNVTSSMSTHKPMTSPLSDASASPPQGTRDLRANSVGSGKKRIENVVDRLIVKQKKGQNDEKGDAKKQQKMKTVTGIERLNATYVTPMRDLSMERSLIKAADEVYYSAKSVLEKLKTHRIIVHGIALRFDSTTEKNLTEIVLYSNLLCRAIAQAGMVNINQLTRSNIEARFAKGELPAKLRPVYEYAISLCDARKKVNTLVLMSQLQCARDRTGASLSAATSTNVNDRVSTSPTLTIASQSSDLSAKTPATNYV